MTIATVVRELLVRYLDTWTPAALHSARRATYLHAWSGPPDVATAEAALRVFGEFGDRLGPNRQLAMVVVAADPTEVARRLADLQRELATPTWLVVHAVAGLATTATPAVALGAAQAAGAPVLACVESDERVPPLAIGRPVELITVTRPGNGLASGDFPLTTGVDLVAADDARLVSFGTGSQKSLEAFKNEMWAVDEFAGVRYRDPGDPDGHLIDISLHPHPGPLRRELLAHLAATGAATVTELRRFTLTRTVYRAADLNAALTSLLTARAVTREPAGGRLAGDVVIRAAG